MRLVVFLCAVLAVAGTAWAEKGDGINAATWYRRASERHRSVVLSDSETRDLHDFQSDPSRGPSESARSLVTRYQAAIVYTLRASRQYRCDYRLNYSATGPFTRQEQFVQLRALARLLRDDSTIKLCDDDSDGAIERLAAMYRLAVHAAQDRTVTSSLAAGALLKQAEDHMQTALEFSAVGPLEAGTLLRAIEFAGMDDSLNYARAVAHEREISTRWMLDRYSGESGAARLAEDRVQFDVPEQLTRLIGCPQSELDAALKAADQAAQLILDVIAIPDPGRVRIEFASIAEQAKHGDFGPLGRETVARLSDGFAASQASQAQLQSRRIQLTEIAEGRLDPKEFANAAVWYIRAATALEKLPTDRLELVRLYAGEHDKAPTPETAELLTDPRTLKVIQTLRDASAMSFCDFKFARSVWPQTLRHYHAGMLQCARLLRADSVRLTHAGDIDGAIDRLAICYRMAAHLTPDHSIAASLIAQHEFTTAHQIVAAAIEGNMLSDQQAAVLSRAVHRFGLAEPFHYQAAIVLLRSDLQAWMVQRFDGEKNNDHAALVRRFLGRCDGDALLFLSLVRDRANDDSASALQKLADQMNRTSEVMEPDAFQQAWKLARDIQRKIERGELEEIDPAGFPSLGRVVQHIAEARAEVRRCQARLKPSEEGGLRSNVMRRVERRP